MKQLPISTLRTKDDYEREQIRLVIDAEIYITHENSYRNDCRVLFCPTKDW